MKEDELAKKIVNILNETLISEEVKLRLSESRTLALKKAQTSMVNTNSANTLSFSEYVSNPYIRKILLFLILGLFMVFLTSIHFPSNQYNNAENMEDIDSLILTDEHPLDFWLPHETNEELVSDQK